MNLHALIYAAPRVIGPWFPGEFAAAIAGLSSGALVAFLAYRFVRRVQWPRRFKWQMMFVHLAALIVFGVLWVGLSILIESLWTGDMLRTRTAWRVVHLPWELPQISVLFYGVILWIANSMEKRALLAQAEAEKARAHLAALRAQLHPHFLFNALHAVVQLIPIDQDRATDAAELIASLLRTTLEENRDEVPLGDEWNLVSKYLEVEHIRFGDRLRVRADVPQELFEERVPSFALQTLVENAVRHGAGNRTAPTDIAVTAVRAQSKLRLSVWNAGEALMPRQSENGTGTGLSRLRERLGLLYGDAAELEYGPKPAGGFEATLVVPSKQS